MEVRILLFGPAADAAGAGRVTIRLDGERTVAALSDAIVRAHPALATAVREGRFAVNHAFASPSTTIRPEDEVALIALVSGG